MVKFIGFILTVLVCLSMMACQDASGPGGRNDPAVVGSWKGRFEAKEFKLFINLKMMVNANRTYSASGTPDLAGAESTVVFREEGRWQVENNMFTATPASCEIYDLATQKLKSTPCPLPDTAAVDISGDSLWTARFRGEVLALTRVK